MKILKSQIISFAERKTLGYPFQEEIKVLCEQTRELTHDFLDYV